MSLRERYVLAAFRIDEIKSVMYRPYFTTNGLAKGVKQAVEDKNADIISIRIIRPQKKVIEK